MILLHLPAPLDGGGPACRLQHPTRHAHQNHSVNMGWNEPVFRGAPPPLLSHRKHAGPPQHLLTMGNSLSRATFRRRASSSSGSLRACEETGRGGQGRLEEGAVGRTAHTPPRILIHQTQGSDKPQTGASQRGGGGGREAPPSGIAPNTTGRQQELGGRGAHRHSQ